MLDALTNIARRVIPDLGSLPLYVVPMPEGRSGKALGTYHPALCQASRADLESQGRWQGEGVAVAMDLERIADSCSNRDDVERRTLGTLLHELIHWARDPLPLPSLDAAADLATDMAAVATLPEPETHLPRFMAMLTSHNDEFVRLSCHVTYRLSHGGGRCLAPHWLAFGSAYPGLDGLGAPHEFMETLDSELERMAGLPLATVATLPAPDHFTNLWAAGVRRVTEQWTARNEEQGR